MKSIPLLALAALCIVGSSQAASPLPAAAPGEVGLSPERLKRVGEFVEQLQKEDRRHNE